MLSARAGALLKRVLLYLELRASSSAPALAESIKQLRVLLYLELRASSSAPALAESIKQLLYLE